MMPKNMKEKVERGILKRRTLRPALFMFAMAFMSLVLPLPLYAGSSIVTMDVEADSSSTAQLTINATSINFPSANPGVVPLVPATQNPVTVTANAQIDAQSTATLTVIAAGDLVSGTSDIIPINKVSWTATGDGFIAGTMNKNTSESAGSWQGPGDRSGTFSFFLANSWSYATGTYSQTVTYTLTAP